MLVIWLLKIKKNQLLFEQDAEALRLQLEKEGLFNSSKLYYMFKLCSNMSLWLFSMVILFKYGQTWTGNFLAAATMALFWQQSGWLAHDFLHHQVFQSRFINHAFGFFIGNVSQGFSVAWWRSKHCTHHSVPNVHDHDPDIDTLPFLAWSEEMVSLFKTNSFTRWTLARQQFFYVPLLCFARLSWAHQSIIYWFKKERIMQNSPELYIELVTLGIHWIWYLGSASLVLSPLMLINYIFVSQALTGIFLAVVFSLNHNGMPIFDKKDKVQFYELQVLTGRNVESNLFTDWFTGGLNYQIEHHLYPSLPRHHFHLVASRVEALCKKHKVSYHRTSMARGLTEVFQRLSAVAKTVNKLKFN